MSCSMVVLRGGGAVFALAVGIGVAASGGCTVTTGLIDDHCANRDGDAYCERVHAGDDGGLRYCAIGVCEVDVKDGCVAARPVEDACYSPCGGDQSLEEEPDCEGVAEGESSSGTAGETDATSEPTGGPTTAGSMSASGSETEGSSSTTGSGCTLSLECLDPASPICVDEACVPCASDDECLEKSPGAPACNEDGRCVACTPTNASACEGVTPICNAVNECEGCDFHEQCPASACRIATGGCFDPAEVYDVGSGQTYANITAAVTDLGVGGEVVLRIHDGASYDEAVTIAGAGTAYALLADDDAMVPQWINSMGTSPILAVEDGAEVYVQSLRFTDSDVEGITADGATLYLDRTQVVGNTGGGLLLTSAASGHLRNCFMGGDVSDVSAVEAVGSSVDILYSTLAAGFGNAAGLRCSGMGMVHVRNSLVVARTDDPAVACTPDSFATSLTEDDLGDMNTNWFAGFGTGNFSLTGMAPPDILTAAQWQAGDSLVDIDGEPRPTEAGTADVAGADIP